MDPEPLPHGHFGTTLLHLETIYESGLFPGLAGLAQHEPRQHTPLRHYKTTSIITSYSAVATIPSDELKRGLSGENTFTIVYTSSAHTAGLFS